MKSNFVEHINGIGDVQFVLSTRAKRINLRLKPGEMTRVSYPRNVDIKRVRAFVIERKEWIVVHREKMDMIEKKSFFDPTKEFRTNFHEFRCTPHQQNTLRANIENKVVDIHYPASLQITSTMLQDAFKSIIVKVLRKEALFYLPERLSVLAKQHGFSYNQLRIKNIKSRWGSCSGKNNINLSLHLMVLPFHLIDFIILHELCHTVHKNHGPRFWELLDKYSGNARGLDKEVKRFQILWS
ncbi:MAG: M48 family metallopeptidase [Bacteroidales bacterium]|nr:M48 family metallopeptidase [Bacteroidales bacterium]MCF8456858.1 M48 family metallopeptidase [Bacteroidales bacterium]